VFSCVPHWRRSHSDVSPHAHCTLCQAGPRGGSALRASAVLEQFAGHGEFACEHTGHAKAACESRRGCRNQGTGKNCAQASDGAGGPTCNRQQVGLCCDAAETSNNCLTLFGDPPLQALTASDGSGAARCADQSGAGPNHLSPFCCQEMDLPSCSAFSDYTQCPVGHQTCIATYMYVSNRCYDYHVQLLSTSGRHYVVIWRSISKACCISEIQHSMYLRE